MLAAALENAGESVIITDGNGIIVHVNSAFYKQMWDSLNGKGEWKGELWNRRKDGSLYPEVLHIRSSRNEHKHVQYYIATFSDIFDPFFSTKEEGAGLGLSMVKGAITAHKGEIYIEDQSGNGTRVRVCLPLHIPNPDSANDSH